MAMLTAESLQAIERELGKYPAGQKRSAVVAAVSMAPRHQGGVARELPCALSGAVEAAGHLKRRCGVEEIKQTSADRRFTGQEGECFGACGDAPGVLVDNKRMCSYMTPEELDKLLEELD